MSFSARVFQNKRHQHNQKHYSESYFRGPTALGMWHLRLQVFDITWWCPIAPAFVGFSLGVLLQNMNQTIGWMSLYSQGCFAVCVHCESDPSFLNTFWNAIVLGQQHVCPFILPVIVHETEQQRVVFPPKNTSSKRLQGSFYWLLP